MALFEKDELKLLWPFYLEVIISTMFMIFPAFWILYFNQINLSFIQIGIIISVYPLAHFIFEVPTGAFADIYGRKASVILGLFLSAIVFFALFFVNSFYSILLLFFFLGVSGTFSSGADTSWITDNLKYFKKEKLLINYFVKISSFANFSLVISGILGAFLVKTFGLSIIWPVSGLSCFISGFILLFISEHKNFENKKENIFSQSTKSFTYIIKHRILLLLTLTSMVMALIFAINSDIVWQPLLVSLGLKDFMLGYVFSLINIIGIITPHFSKPLLRLFRKEKIFFIALSLISFLITLPILLVRSWVFAVIIQILFVVFFIDIKRPIFEGYFQKFNPSSLRASISSLKIMAASVGGIIGSLLAGFFANKFGPQITIFISAMLILPLIVLYLLIKENSSKKV
jgi:MFS family permease